MKALATARIMVIEDDPDLMRLMTHALKTAGVMVVQAYGGEDALRKVHANPPDVIFTDLAMPKISGVEIIEKLKRDPTTQHIPIIAVTAHTWDAIAQAAGAVGVDAFIAKPFTAARLLKELAKYVAVPEPQTASARR